MLTEIIEDRYQIIKELGKGGMGTVYLAQDQEKQKQVALKLINVGAKQSRRRTVREFRIMSQLKHPHVINVYQSGTYEDETPYIVMPYLSGGTLSDSYAGGTKEDDLLERLTRISEVAEALHYIHRESIIHRDLKPDNIMLDVDEEGNKRALLMDFGLAKRQAQESVLVELQSEQREFAGSIHYASPEQIRSRELDIRSDLYSLGCLLYWVVAGSPPFTGDLAAVLWGHMNEAIKPLSQYHSFVPPLLDEITLKLLKKEPIERYSDAAEVVLLIQEVIEILNPTKQEFDRFEEFAIPLSPTTPLGNDENTPARLFIPPMIGRDDEWQVCKVALEELLAGKSNTILLQGGFGLGLSRLLAEIEQEANLQGVVLLKFNNYQGNNLPYEAWRDVLRSLQEHRKEVFLEAAEGLEAALALILPEIGVNESYELPPDIAQMRLFHAVEQFLSSFLAKKPVVILVDNAHLADKGTLDLFAYLARSQFTSMCMVVAWHASQEYKAIDKHIKNAFDGLSKQNLDIKPLNEQQARALLRAFLGSELDKALESYVLERIGGNPLFAEELLSALLKEKHIRRRKGLWEWTRQSTDLPERIEEAFTARLAVLSEGAQKTLGIASTIGRDFDFDLLCELLKADEDDLLDDIDEFLKAGLVEELTDDRYRFTHVLLREVLHKQLSNNRRQRYHQKLVEILKERKDTEFAVLADHYAETKAPYLAVSYALEVSRKAGKVFANDVAENYLRLALDCIEKAEISNEAADSHIERKAKIQLDLGSILERIGKWDEAESLYKSAGENKDLYSRALYSLGGLNQARGDLGQSELYLRQALEISPDNSDFYFNLGNVLFAKANFLEAEEVLYNGLSLALEEENDSNISLFHSSLGYLEYRRNNWEMALEWLASAKEYADAEREPLRYARVNDIEGAIYTRLGNLDQALSHYEEAHKIYQRSGDIGRAVKALLQLGKVYQDRGKLSQATEILEQVCKQAERLGRESIKLDAKATLGWTLQRQGRFKRALELLEQSYLPLLNQGHKSKAILHRMNMAVVAARYGKAEDARQYLQETDTLLQNISISPYLLALSLLTLGEIELRSGQLEAALTSLTDGAKQLKASQCQQELLEAYLLLAETQLALGQKDRCEDSLLVAQPLANQISDPVWELHINYLWALNNEEQEKISELKEELALHEQTYLIDMIRATTGI